MSEVIGEVKIMVDKITPMLRTGEFRVNVYFDGEPKLVEIDRSDFLCL